MYLLTFLLKSKGYEVIQAKEGHIGIDLAVTEKPDLILLDIQLPVMDGYAVARAMRTNMALAKIPIIAVTSYAMVGDREKALRSGCSGFVEKPINPDTFLDEIERFLPCTASEDADNQNTQR